MTSRASRVAGAVLDGAIRGYQLSLAALFPGACRYEPSCSSYARSAIALHGPLHGSLLSVRRICRCHPWGGCGYDPVPQPAGSSARTTTRLS